MKGFKIAFTDNVEEYVAATKHRESGNFIVFHGGDGAEVKRVQTRLVRSITPVEDVDEASKSGPVMIA